MAVKQKYRKRVIPHAKTSDGTVPVSIQFGHKYVVVKLKLPMRWLYWRLHDKLKMP